MTTGWKQAGELKGSDTVSGDLFGSSVAVSGTTAVVGASNAKSAGRAYVFSKTRTGWRQVAELKGSCTGTLDEFGYSVAVSPGTAVVSAFGHDHYGGRAYIFTKAAGWKQVAVLKGSDTVASDQFGYSVAISGTTGVVGAIGHANGAGRAYVFGA